ncbi:SAM-dependent methyltransferase [Streptomyces sp. NBC_01387]|uniref:SAM-dependent methyltransferase n=1 Tax=unclassified Streptomyces TaxID=2593676 RepID=UPI00202447E5|nr:MULTISPECIES: SAM-dependent methyltransferase [unclassified Streptomyces]MCX4553569.1 SAM-dependent methyltransferase [Streptomyces sp. NBC_01500]WSC18520.1 SAM-dependent methyltransferase [Streptomyces sp. NBC_01766]WSV52561.1 SAM-dependent methyltransferase [Streptomyces sp. NBC_01014]
MERPAWAPQGIDLSVPSVSRIYDYYLGGSHNFEVDREAARKAMEFMPGLPKVMQANRAFMRRAVRFAVESGITQFLDIGSGIPTFGNVHEVAQAMAPEARVVYVDHDPVAVAHSKAVLDGNELASVVAADLRKPQEILDSPEVVAGLDLDRPVALLLVAVLHFIEDADDPCAAVAALRDALAPGSLLILTHASYEGIPVPEEQAGGAVGVYRNIRNPLVMRSREEVARFFDGFELVEPGLVAMPEWRPEAPVDQEDPYAFAGFVGVGLKA